eukprot:SAG22_NODE_323_length_12378_cov_19.294975_3_plen_54_part_00
MHLFNQHTLTTETLPKQTKIISTIVYMFEEIANFEMEIYKVMKIVIETIEKNI